MQTFTKSNAAANFPSLWFIEVNASYYGFFSNNNHLDSVNNTGNYNKHINGTGYLGADFKNYYNGEIKMGDTPSLLYMMDGNPNQPGRENWGGSFEKINRSARNIFNRSTTIKDTVAFCSIVEFKFTGPEINIPSDSVCFWMQVPYKNTVQKWPGYYVGNGQYAIRYIPKQAETLQYYFTTAVPGLVLNDGALVVTNKWPGKPNVTDYKLCNNWYSDKAADSLYDGKIQGGKTISKWRLAFMQDWAGRWQWLK